MFDIWGFLLQTLTVSGVAVLLLVVLNQLRNNLKYDEEKTDDSVTDDNIST